MVLRIESWRHLKWPSLITEVQLLRKLICVWGLPHNSQLGDSIIFQRTKLLLLLREKIRVFLQKLKIFDGRVLINEFQFLIRVFETFCWSDDIKVFFSFKLFIDVIISFWISLSRVDLAIFAFADLFTILSFRMIFMTVISKSSPILWFFEDLRMFRTAIWFNLNMSQGSFKPIPSCMTLRCRWLMFPEISILSHLRTYRFALLSKFCIVQVSGKWYIVRLHLSSLQTNFVKMFILWFECKEKMSIFSR